MLSVGIFSYSTKPRGSVVHAACLAEALQRRGAQVTLYALSKAGDGFFRPLSCELRLLPAAKAPSDVDALIRQRIAEFRAGLDALQPRHEICHAEDCLAANALAAAKPQFGGAALVRTVHHVEHFESPYLMDCQERSVSSADLVLSVSQVTSRDVRAAFGREAPVISNGVDLQRFAVRSVAEEQRMRERLGLAVGDLVILSVGGVEARKNSLGALEAVALAFARQRRLRWVIVGGASIWEHEAYRAEFARRLAQLPLELQTRIEILGTVPEADLTALYHLSDVLLCPSLQEGFGLCVLEALAAKCAVVVPRGAPFDEYLDERCASFVDPGSASGIEASLSLLLNDPGERRRSAEEGYKRVQRYSWDLVAERHLARYESLLNRDTPVLQQRQY
ncbi:MAG TPA: MSMEG_0565 family glycosyltransferase [Polyangiaceae bacterium]|nr:MSMEG_0565 family glycosyltransferase [Polyangiaceae bacterium]